MKLSRGLAKKRRVWVFCGAVKQLFLSVLFLGALLSAQDDSGARLREIDQQIYQLNLDIARHHRQAEVYQAEGDRLQFQTYEFPDAEAAWAKAEKERVQERRLEDDVFNLQAERDKLLYGESAS